MAQDPLNTGAPPTPPATRVERLHAYRYLLLIAGFVFGLDRLTKSWVATHLPFPTYGGPDTISIVRGFCNIVHVGNTGAAWSMFSGAGYALAALAAATLIAIYLWRDSLGLRDQFAQICFGLLCGGIAGNLTDRLLYGHVIDFIDLHFGSYVYPTFNVADSGICVGVALYLWQSLRAPK